MENIAMPIAPKNPMQAEASRTYRRPFAIMTALFSLRGIYDGVERRAHPAFKGCTRGEPGQISDLCFAGVFVLLAGCFKFAHLPGFTNTARFADSAVLIDQAKLVML
jgi:hypothetical protein